MNIKRINQLIITLVFSLVISACSDDDDHPAPPVVVAPPAPEAVTVYDTAVANGSFTTLVAALQATGLDETLDNEDATFTVFAPTDAAFALLGQETIDGLLQDTDTLSGILTYHVLASEVNAEAAIAAAGNKVATVNGAEVGLSLDGANLLINTATVTTTDIMTDNGIIHVIDAVLMPPAAMATPTMNIVETAVAAGSFTTLVSALQTAGLDSVLANPDANFTVFAPTDEAFAMIDSNLLDGILADSDALNAILLQHVVPDAAVDSVTAYTLNGMNATTVSGAQIPIAINSTTDKLTFGGANVVTKDIYTTNGVIHVIDMVVVADVALPEPLLTVADVAAANGSFNTLVAALQATGLDSVLDNPSTDFTVFAPTDDAFALLGEDTIAALLADPETLSNILLYHLVSGAEVLQDAAVTIAQSDMNKVAMANEQMAALSYVDSNLFINKSAVSTPNVMADNGVIHVVDQVILPPAMKGMPTSNIAEVVSSDANFSTLLAALTAADLATTLADEDSTFTVFAPTNAAFDKIPDSVLDNLLADTPALTQVLLQHVVGNAEINSVAAFAANGANVNTLANDDVTVALVNYSQVMATAADEVAYNKMMELLVGGDNSSNPGHTLYVFDNDLGSAGSNCNDGCATNWPPVLVTDGAASMLPGITLIDRDDGAKQAAFNGRPLYFFAGDNQAGDMNGQGLNDLWWTVKQEQISLQVQGANVTTFDIYTNNGVIHVIDTVITETLQ